MKKILMYALTLSIVLSFSGCNSSASQSSPSAQEETASSPSESIPLQTQEDHEENQPPEPVFRIDTEKKLVWYEGFDEDRISLTQYEYDEAGRLLRTVPVGESGSTGMCYEYDEAGNLIRESDSDEIFVTSYTYDDQGRLSSTTQVYDGTILSVETYSYDDQGRKMMANEEGIFQGDPGRYTATTAFSYDENGRLVEEERATVSQIVDEYKSQELSRTEYLYQDDGKLAERRTYSGEKLTSKTTYTYDQEKLSIQSTEYEPSRETEVLNFEYDDHGNLTREITIRLNDKGAQLSRVTCEYTYTEVAS